MKAIYVTLLIDPVILLRPLQESLDSDSKETFWRAIVEWASDARVRIGEESHALVVGKLAQYGYPDNDLDLPLSARREYQAALSKLLGRVQPTVDRAASEVTLSVVYLGSDIALLALSFDIPGSVSAGIRGLATDTENWDDPNSSVVKVDPPPPADIELCFTPGAELDVESVASMREFYLGRQLFLVGGQVENRVVAQIIERTGIEESAIRWLPCEKAKPPRDLDKRWKHLDPNRDVTVCVTGRVGHATSLAAASAARKSGTVHLQVEHVSEIVGALESLHRTG